MKASEVVIAVPGGKTHTNPLLQDVIRYVPSTILPAILGVVSAAIFTRLFIPREYGQLILINSITGPLVSVISQMFGQPAGRYFADLKQEGLGGAYARVLSLVLQRIMIGILGLLVMVAGFIWLIDPGLSNWLYLLLGAGVGMGVQSAASLVTPVLPLVRDFRGYQRYALGTAVLALVVPLGLVLWQGAHVVWMIWGGAIASIIMMVPLLERTQPHNPLQLRGIEYGAKEREVFRKFFRYGAPMAIWFFAASMISTSDRYVIGAYMGTGAVAIYGSSYTIATQVIGFLTGPIVTATWPTIMTTWANTKSVVEVKTIMARATDLYLMLGIGMVGGSVVVGKDVVGMILSPKYFAGYTIIPPVMAGLVVWGASMLGHKSMEVMERNDLMIGNAIGSAALNLGLNMVLVPRYGWQIAAYTTLASYCAYASVTWWIARRMVPWDIRYGRTLLYLAVAATADVITDFTWSGRAFVPSLIIRGIVFSAGYFGAGFLIYRRGSSLSEKRLARVKGGRRR